MTHLCLCCGRSLTRCRCKEAFRDMARRLARVGSWSW